ncbi:hypothetical protein BX600DRAFT_92541 [Xylariales sp. PMI_506]|nr:hypothetical protein BX600DRAFT_92541 [Xylariales sp. PMI_506]
MHPGRVVMFSCLFSHLLKPVDTSPLPPPHFLSFPALFAAPPPPGFSVAIKCWSGRAVFTHLGHGRVTSTWWMGSELSPSLMGCMQADHSFSAGAYRSRHSCCAPKRQICRSSGLYIYRSGQG